MRVLPIAALFLAIPVIAAAQQAPIPAAAPASAASSTRAALQPPITRDQYIQRAQQRASERAAALFDRMDANHDGTVDATEYAAWRTAHPYHARARTQQTSAPAATPAPTTTSH